MKRNELCANSISRSVRGICSTRPSSYFCKIDATPRPPVSDHPKGWSPALQRKLESLKSGGK